MQNCTACPILLFHIISLTHLQLDHINIFNLMLGKLWKRNKIWKAIIFLQNTAQ